MGSTSSIVIEGLSVFMYKGVGIASGMAIFLFAKKMAKIDCPAARIPIMQDVFLHWVGDLRTSERWYTRKRWRIRGSSIGERENFHLAKRTFSLSLGHSSKHSVLKENSHKKDRIFLVEHLH